MCDLARKLQTQVAGSDDTRLAASSDRLHICDRRLGGRAGDPGGAGIARVVTAVDIRDASADVATGE